MPGSLLSGSYVKTLSAAAIDAALSSPDSRVQPGSLAPRYDVAAYRLTYLSTDKYGVTTPVSGLISVPVKPAGAVSPVLSYQHATTFLDANAPSNKVEPYEPPQVLASLGYIVVSPDYVGFGASKGQDHPYLVATPTARVVIDMLRAAQAWRQGQKVVGNGQLFLVGYSEGGYATMAAHRAIQQEGGALKTQLQAAVPGAGPYDILKTLDEQLARVSSTSSVLGTLLDPSVLSRLPTSVRNEVRRLLLRQMVPEDGDVSYQTLFLDRYMANQRDLLARDHSVHLGWAPEAPVYLFHGRQDMTVPYAASESARDALRAAGGRDVTLTDCTTGKLGHLDCVPEYFVFAVNRMARLARDL
ncbi:alpha/beta hydrolase family protein [Ottowia sp. SB7-C50]|uniref:alpha/beta hydrolase family protein n=1 Tax=Ottowia sp. SB7-C50 TaxID=3081231 RepID=UPI002955479A|nr:lipase family protein [Ottowia sp. SB7-C50]WOP15667.1 lipase family protein [Ottowia sp. SB7-C50]